MRSLALLALLVPLTPVAHAAPTVEEQALRAALEGRSGEAVRLLGGDADPRSRWAAGRHALLVNDYAAASRLLSGQALREEWGRIDLAAARGDVANAAALALGQMDRALGGVHRDALGELLIGWAAERAATDPGGAAGFLVAALGLEPSAKVRRAAEDALFRLPPVYSGGQVDMARRRLEADPENVPARTRVAVALAPSRPTTAWQWLYLIVLKSDRADALAAARHLAALDIPSPLVLDGLAALLRRFPQDADVARLLLEDATARAPREPTAADAMLAALERVPAVAVEATEARATATLDPKARRERWLAIAQREGASARGDAARAQAYAALVAGVHAAAEGPARVAAAKAALDTPDGAGTPELLYLAIPEAPAGAPAEVAAARTTALRALAARFPDGAWCDELGDRLVAAGANREDAETYAATCTSPASVGGSILFGHVTGDTRLHLEPRPGAVEVAASAADVLRVSQHRVDPEALFRATDGHPLDAALDAFLLEPDLTWDVRQPGGGVKTHRIAPRGRGALAAVTVRAGDQRGTALVVADPLDVQLVRRGADVALGVLRAGAPVGGAELLLVDTAGASRRARTDGSGVVVLRDLPDTVRVMARKGDALGFATESQGDTVDVVGDTWSVVAWDRAAPEDGAIVDVSVFGSRPGGAATGPARLRSLDTDGRVLAEVDVPLDGGVGRARLFAVGHGALVLLDGGQEVARATVNIVDERRPPVKITWEPADPRPGERVTAAILPVGPLGPGGLAGEVTVGTPWARTTQPIVLGPEGALFPIDLLTADEGAIASLTLRLPDGRSWSSDVEVHGAREGGPVGGVPSIVAAGTAFPVEVPAGGWLRATSAEGRVVWARAGEPVALPTAGTWQLCAWVDRCGPDTPVVVADGAIGADGRWAGAPVLAAVLAEGIRSARFVRPGDDLRVGDTRGVSNAWVRAADVAVAPVPLHGAPTPTIAVAGALTRGGTSTLDVGTGLPEGSRIWAFLRDAPDGHRRPAARVAVPVEGGAGALGDAWSAEARWGEAIAAALLEEEERLAEATEIERVDFGFSAAAEVGGLGGIGTSGYGSGAGGMAGHVLGGVVGGQLGGRHGRGSFPGDPRAIAVIEAAAPGPLRIDVPTWIAAADLELVARTPDGRWASRVVRLDVGGAPLTAMPGPAPYTPPTTWDGTLAALVPVARSLPPDAREHAFAALANAGAAGTDPPRATGHASPARVLARQLRGGAPPPPAGSVDAIPDLRRADRAVAALTLASTDPDRARAAATRLLASADLEPWARARAGLALWVAGAPDEARAALVGEDATVAAARAVVDGRADARFAAAWWTTARAEGARAEDRALAIHALTLLEKPRPVDAVVAPPPPADGVVAIDPPLAAWRGEAFARGYFGDGDPRLGAHTGPVPLGRVVPAGVSVPASPVPTRLACPSGPGVTSTPAWIDLPASRVPNHGLTCELRASVEGKVEVAATWYGPDGTPLETYHASFTVVPARDSLPTDLMSSKERLGLGLRLAAAGDPPGVGLLERLLAETPLPAAELQRASGAVLAARRGGEPWALVNAFRRYREQVPGGALDLDTASALAHAYARTGDPARALAAARVVMDARFKEELGAVSALRSNGLDLTALKLLRELVDRYPEGPTVVSARYLLPGMLLGRAEGDGDRLGYTRSSLRHTAAAELATFLLLHPDAPQAPEAAALLVDALHALGDPDRERALAGPLARRYRDDAAAWRLSLADARATLAAGQAGAAVRILDALAASGAGRAEVELERGRALEALGRLDAAREAYDRSGAAEATERRAWLDREDLVLPETLVLAPGEPARVKARLRPGAEVTVTAIRVLLEAALLRDGGTLDPWTLNVAGLKPTASRTGTVGPDGDVALPALPDGAYVVTVTTGASSGRMVLVRTDAELAVESRAGGGTLVHLSDVGGRPLRDAQLWLFDGGGTVTAARTDGGGAAFVPFGDGRLGALAKAGDRYALANLDGDGVDAGASPAMPAPTEGYGDVLRKNEAAYDELFRQEAEQKVGASAL